MDANWNHRPHLAALGAWTALAVTVLATVVGCGGNQDGADRAEGVASAASVTATTAQGMRLTVPGRRPALLYFFSITCAPVGLAAISQIRTAHPDADYVAVDLDQDANSQQIHQYLASAGAGSLAVATDPQAAAMAAYQITAEGTTVVVGPHGGTTYSGLDPSTGRLASALSAAAHR